MSRTLRAAATSLAVILVIALAIRLTFLWNYASHNPPQALGTIPFLFESGNIAVSLATGHGFASPFRIDTGPTAWMTPVYPALLAAIFRIFGIYKFQSYVAAAFLNILATTLACIPIYHAGKRVGGLGVAATAAWLWAIFPNAFQIPAESMWDASLGALLAATVLGMTLWLPESRRTLSWISYGLLWGLALMTSATLASLLPLFLLWLAWRLYKQHEKWLARPALAALIAVLCCVPWTVRNYKVFHAFVPLRSILGLQLWVGNNPQAGDLWLGTQHPIHDSAERTQYVELGEIQYMAQKRHDALGYMSTHPAREADLISHRFLAFWSGGTPHPVRDFFRARSLWFRFVLLFNVLVAFGALAGLIVLIRRRSVWWFPFTACVAVFPWAYCLTVVEPRYALPIGPALMLLCAIALPLAFQMNPSLKGRLEKTGFMPLVTRPRKGQKSLTTRRVPRGRHNL